MKQLSILALIGAVCLTHSFAQTNTQESTKQRELDNFFDVLKAESIYPRMALKGQDMRAKQFDARSPEQVISDLDAWIKLKESVVKDISQPRAPIACQA